MDPIMQQVVNIIVARGTLTLDQITDWAAADMDFELIGPYEDYIAPAINQMEDEIIAFHKTMKEV